MEAAKNRRIIQNIFRYYFTRHPDIKLPLKDIKAVEAIMKCCTTERGYNLLSCPQGHENRVQAHACRHRSCPLCAERSRYEWIEQEKQRLLDRPHFHVIFTLPHEYLTLWAYNRRWFTRQLFKACRDTLLELLKDSRYLGAKPGILMTLHTWGRQLNYHPHIHCLVSAGGLTPDGEWRDSGDYLLPIRVVKALYRGKLQAWIREALLVGELRLPKNETRESLLAKHRQLFQKHWSVRIQDKYEHGRGVALYLARYLKGGPIKPAQIQATGNEIALTYRDHRDQRRKVLRLKLDEFIRRLLWHVPEGGIHVVRHYGLYATRNQVRREALRKGEASYRQSTGQLLKDAVNWCCEQCGALLQRTYTSYQRRDYENSYNKVASAKIVQQEVQDGTLETERSPPMGYQSHASIFFSSRGVRLT